MKSVTEIPRPRPAAFIARSTYRRLHGYLQSGRRGLLAALLLCGIGMTQAGAAAARTLHIVALGDSLTAGYMLPQDAAFPTVLEKQLRAKGFDVEVANAGVSGDTAADGLARLDWSVPDGTDGVIVELGANDMLRGLDPKTTGKTLAEIVAKLQGRGMKVLVAGMLATPSLGPDYVKAFDGLYPALSRRFDVPLYPFFLDGMAADPKLHIADGLHPNRAGVDVIVSKILPSVEAWLKTIHA